ncbi:DUF7660 family protein [Streptomyces rimosus]
MSGRGHSRGRAPVVWPAGLVFYVRRLSNEDEAVSRYAEIVSGIWENGSLNCCLEALSAWTNDMDGYFLNRGEPVPEQLAGARSPAC